MIDLKEIKKVYFIGIGGIGMSAIARMLLGEGKQVFGSDRAESLVTDELEKLYRQATAQDNLLLLNCPPDTNGHMRPDNVKRLVELRERLGLKVGGPFPARMNALKK